MHAELPHVRALWESCCPHAGVMGVGVDLFWLRSHILPYDATLKPTQLVYPPPSKVHGGQTSFSYMMIYYRLGGGRIDIE